MNLVRLAVLTLSDSAEKDDQGAWTTEADGVQLTAHTFQKDPGAAHMLVTAELPLDSLPSRNESGQVVIDEESLRRCERVVERFADLAAVATRSSRKLSSPSPEVGFSGVTEEERAWLDECAGIHRPSEWEGVLAPKIDLSDPSIPLLNDRSDGVALLAEALSIDHPTGRFLELLRVFERGFKCSPYKLIDPVAEFLAYFDVLEYGKDDTYRWFKTLRDKASHADRRSDFALARDVEPVLARVELGAYDVLFNKLNWRSPDSERRDAWTPDGGMLPDGSAVLRKDGRAPFHAKLMDGFGAFPLNLEARLQMPTEPDWWLEGDAGSRTTRAGRISVVDSLRTLTNT
jgi:hypothetical protein